MRGLFLLWALTGAPTEPADRDPGDRSRDRQEAAQVSRLSHDYGWTAGSIEDQLDRDTTLVPFGKGAVFVPVMTNPLDEPPVEVWQGDRRAAEGTTGQRIVLSPGQYEVRLGTGARSERIRIQTRVRENNTTVIPPSWAGLQVHVVDAQLGSLRTSYELIRVEDREYIGLGFGTDEQAGEPVSTWIIRPGLYKIVRVGETYRARRDFSTVRLVEGQLTHFLLVMDADTGEFEGGGEVPEEDLFRPREGFYGSVVLGGDVSLNGRTNVAGFQDGFSVAARAFLDGRLSVEIANSPLLLQLQIEEGQTKAPDLPFQKTNDRADLDGLYVYRLEPWVGPYIRFGIETNLLKGIQFFDKPEDVRILDADGALLETRSQIDRLTLSPPAGLWTLKEGVGLNLRVFKSIFAETTVRSGVGARHRIARDLLEESDDLEFRFIDSTNQVGVEATVLAQARFTRWVLATLELDSLLPFQDFETFVLEIEASMALKLTSYASLNYVFRFLRDRALSDDDRIQHDVLLRFSLEII